MSDVPVRRIAHRERKPIRAFGLSYPEWGAVVGPLLLIWSWWPGFLLSVTLTVTDLVLVLVVARRFRANELRDHARAYVDTLRFGGRYFGPAARDRTLRDGAGFLRDRTRRLTP